MIAWAPGGSVWFHAVVEPMSMLLKTKIIYFCNNEVEGKRLIYLIQINYLKKKLGRNRRTYFLFVHFVVMQLFAYFYARDIRHAAIISGCL